MTTENDIHPLYSELARNTPDLPALAERCKLLTELLLDCDSLPQTQPVCRCLAAYLDAFNAELDKSITEFREIDEDLSPPQRRNVWLLDSTEVQCDCCRALTHVLLVSHFDRDMLPHLTRLLHALTHSLLADMTVLQIH